MNKSQRKVLEAIQVDIGGYCADCDEDAREQPDDAYYRGYKDATDSICSMIDEKSIDATMREMRNYEKHVRWLMISAWLFHPIRTFKYWWNDWQVK